MASRRPHVLLVLVILVMGYLIYRSQHLEMHVGSVLTVRTPSSPTSHVDMGKDTLMNTPTSDIMPGTDPPSTGPTRVPAKDLAPQAVTKLHHTSSTQKVPPGTPRGKNIAMEIVPHLHARRVYKVLIPIPNPTL